MKYLITALVVSCAFLNTFALDTKRKAATDIAAPAKAAKRKPEADIVKPTKKTKYICSVNILGDSVFTEEYTKEEIDKGLCQGPASLEETGIDTPVGIRQVD